MAVQSYGNVSDPGQWKKIQSNTGTHTLEPLLSFPSWILEAVLHGLTSEFWNLSGLAPGQNFFPHLNCCHS